MRKPKYEVNALTAAALGLLFRLLGLPLTYKNVIPPDSPTVIHSRRRVRSSALLRVFCLFEMFYNYLVIEKLM
jgi:hypothetical protein